MIPVHIGRGKSEATKFHNSKKKKCFFFPLLSNKVPIMLRGETPAALLLYETS